MAYLQSIQSVEQYNEITQKQEPTVLVFSADWCPDCRYLDTYVDEVVEEYKGRLEFYLVDRDEQAALCESLDVLGIPSFIVFQSGREVSRFVNGKRKFKPEVLEFLNGALDELKVSK